MWNKKSLGGNPGRSKKLQSLGSDRVEYKDTKKGHYCPRKYVIAYRAQHIADLIIIGVVPG